MGVIACVAAKELGVSTSTVKVWANRGLLPTTRTAGGWRLYDMDSVLRMKKKMRKDRA